MLAKNMYRKADFTHQSITMATHLNPSPLVLADALGGRGHVKDLSGWEGDTTKNANDMAPSIGNDDYKADLDAVNMVERMKEFDKSYTEISNEYYKELKTGDTNRASEFKKNVDFDSVQKTILDSLAPKSGVVDDAYNKGSGDTLIESWSEQNRTEYLKKSYSASYNFIESLDHNDNELKDYASGQ